MSHKPWNPDISNSTLRPHLGKHHLAEYIEAAEKYKWEVLYVNLVRKVINNGDTIMEIKDCFNAGEDLRALPKCVNPNATDDPLHDAGDRGTVPAFSLDNFHEHLAAFIVADNQVSYLCHIGALLLTLSKSLNVVECPEFCKLMLLLRESLRDTDIPHRSQTRDNIMNLWLQSFGVLQTQARVCAMWNLFILQVTVNISRPPWVMFCLQQTFGQIRTSNCIWC